MPVLVLGADESRRSRRAPAGSRRFAGSTPSANLALAEQNADVAAQIAVALASAGG